VFVHVDKRPKARTPWLTFVLIVVCVAMFVWLAYASEGVRVQFVREWGMVPARLFNPSSSLLGTLTDLNWVHLFSALFIHVGWLHLTGDMLFLMILGVPAERALGSWRFLLLFLVGGALANLAQALSLADATTPIVGSSGAVSAIIGAYLGLFPRARLGLVLPLGFFFEFVRIPALLLIGFWALLQVAFTFVGPAFGAIAWWTHIVGFLLGILFAMIARPAVARRLRD